MGDPSEQSEFEAILSQLNLQGHFAASVLASEDGLPIAAAPSPGPYDAEEVAAMVTLVKEFITQTQERLGLAEVNEVSMVVADRSRLVCRYFKTAERCFVLALVAPPDLAYRRLMKRATREICAAWAA